MNQDGHLHKKICKLTTVANLGEGPGGPGSPLFWAKKRGKLQKEKGPAGQGNKKAPPPPHF